MSPSLEHCFTMRLYFLPTDIQDVKAVKGGLRRMFIPLTSGFLRGAGLDAEVMPGSAYAPLMDDEANTVYIDVRLSLRTKKGHVIYVRYKAVLQSDDKVQKVLGFTDDAESTQFGDHEWFATPTFETSDPDFKWIERAVLVGEGRWIVEDDKFAIEYELYRLRPSQKS